VVFLQFSGVDWRYDFIRIAFDHLHVDKLLYAGKPYIAAIVGFEKLIWACEFAEVGRDTMVKPLNVGPVPGRGVVFGFVRGEKTMNTPKPNRGGMSDTRLKEKNPVP
jgi:hypothetical protein